jgi:hypothetical protein
MGNKKSLPVLISKAIVGMLTMSSKQILMDLEKVLTTILKL